MSIAYARSRVSRSQLRELPPAERTVPRLLLRQAELYGDRPLVSIGDETRSFARTAAVAASFAGMLAEHGVHPGDRVLAMSSNRGELLDTVLGSAWRGAIAVPINVSLRGPQFEHVLTNADPKRIVIEPQLLNRLDLISARPPSLQGIWTLGEPSVREWKGVPVQGLPGAGDSLEPHSAGHGDTAVIIYTSGTTGPSKGVCSPHAHLPWWGSITGEHLELTPDDVIHTVMPMFHVGPWVTFYMALLFGCSCRIDVRFSASRFWDDLQACGATVTNALGAMLRILADQPPHRGERAHRVRVILAPGAHADSFPLWRERFGIDVVEAWGSTETNHVLGAPLGEQRPGWMGRVVDDFDARVVDEEDRDVGAGVQGELVVRSKEPYSFFTGYFRNADATVDACRNLWFHTGDRVVRDTDGCFRFVDRLSESIRRRGENISSYEIEQVMHAHPSVAGAAAVPVPSELGEDEVMAYVLLCDGAATTEEELIRWCEPRLAYFSVPRYIELVDEFPLTGSGKIAKAVLRERGVSKTTWDRDAAGVTLDRGG